MFNPCPALQTQPLPFAIDELDFLKWLKSLSTPESNASCELLLQVLRTLNHTDLAGKTRLLFLEKLGALLFQLSAKQTKLTFAQNMALPKDYQRRLETTVWSCAELAQGYTLLSKADNFKGNKSYSLQQKSLIISHGIQAMSKALLYISQSYTTPYPHFWRTCFEFYQLGQQYQLTDLANPGVALIENAFKQLLVFNLSNSNQFSQLEMSVIYDLLGQYASYAKLLPPTAECPSRNLPAICLDRDAPPARYNVAAHKPTAQTLYIATAAVAGKLLEAVPNKTQHQYANDKLMLLRLAKTLTLHQKRRDRRERTQGAFFGIIGFDSVITFLHGIEPGQNSRLAMSGHFDATHPGQLGNLNYTIAKNEDDDEKLAQYNLKRRRSGQKANPKAFKVIEFTDSAEIWKKGKTDHFETNTALIDKSKQGYCLLLTNKQLQPKVGHLIGLNHKHFDVGIIRWVTQGEASRLLIGIELMGKQAQAVRISNPGFPNFEGNAIYLPADALLEQAESLVLLAGAFNPAEFFFMHKEHRNMRFRLAKLIHATAFIRHFEIVPA